MNPEVLREFGFKGEEGDQVGYPGWGWDKVTKHHGEAGVGHASITVEREVAAE